MHALDLAQLHLADAATQLAEEVLARTAPAGRDRELLALALHELAWEPGSALAAVRHCHGSCGPASDIEQELADLVVRAARLHCPASYRQLLDPAVR